MPAPVFLFYVYKDTTVTKIHTVSLLSHELLATNKDFFPKIVNQIWSDHKLRITVLGGISQCAVEKDGAYYVIMTDNVVVGIIGWYPYGGDKAGMRWSGIIKTARDSGYYRQAVKMLAGLLPPNIKHLTNVTPKLEIADFFVDVLGFKILEDPKLCVTAVREAYEARDYQNYYVVSLPVNTE